MSTAQISFMPLFRRLDRIATEWHRLIDRTLDGYRPERQPLPELAAEAAIHRRQAHCNRIDNCRHNRDCRRRHFEI